MTFSVSWHTLLDELGELHEGATLVTPLSNKQFRVTDVQEQQIIINFEGKDEKQPLQCDQFETLYENITDAINGFDLDNLPPNAEPYATVLSIHPNFEVDTQAWTLQKAETPSDSPLLNPSTEEQSDESQSEGDQSELLEPHIQEMMDNMGDPKDEVACPIDGCQYSHQSASSVARHVSGSSTAKHIWKNTDYAGWRDFVRKHGESPG